MDVYLPTIPAESTVFLILVSSVSSLPLSPLLPPPLLLEVGVLHCIKKNKIIMMTIIKINDFFRFKFHEIWVNCDL